jgi:membrane-bound lytic murein transglycosylase F
MAWKAQLYQESRLDPDAVSPVGAAGLAQFMPATWSMMVKEMHLGVRASPHTARFAIPAGAAYMANLRRQWSAPRPQGDRHALAAASYNAGLGHLLNAQKLCGGKNRYLDIIRCLPRVTGKHSEETIQYVKRIWHWWRLMEIEG